MKLEIFVTFEGVKLYFPTTKTSSPTDNWSTYLKKIINPDINNPN